MKLARVETPGTLAELRASWSVCDLIDVPVIAVDKNVFDRRLGRARSISSREAKQSDRPFRTFYEPLPLLGIESGKLDDSRNLSAYQMTLNVPGRNSRTPSSCRPQDRRGQTNSTMSIPIGC